jgi:hypothetical protein
MQPSAHIHRKGREERKAEIDNVVNWASINMAISCNK